MNLNAPTSFRFTGVSLVQMAQPQPAPVLIFLNVCLDGVEARKVMRPTQEDLSIC